MKKRKDASICELTQIRSAIRQKYAQQEDVDFENNIREYNNIDIAINVLKTRESDEKLKLRQVLDEIEKNRADRTIAVERYFLLKIKLQDIEQAKELLQKLDLIHKMLPPITNPDPFMINKETSSLKEITVDFINKYVNQST